MAQQKTSLAALKEKAAEHALKAKEIQSKIKELENERYLKVGKLVADFQKKNWEGFDLSSFKKTISEIISA
jgi:hypothetical protein